MINDPIILHPPHYVAGRTIEPIKVIEDWSLCHHLACVVKYISRAGRKACAIQDLEKAAWYLERENQLISPCPLSFPAYPSLDIEAVIQDWGVCANLAKALRHLKLAKESPLKTEALQNALNWLKAEIHHQLQERNNP